MFERFEGWHLELLFALQALDFDKNREQFSLSMVKQQTSQLLTVATA